MIMKRLKKIAILMALSVITMQVQANGERAESALIEGSENALLIVDLQNSFCYPDGSLKVENTDKEFKQAHHTLAVACKKAGMIVAATQDWHPELHRSFNTRWDDENGNPAQPFTPMNDKYKQRSPLFFKNGERCEEQLEPVLPQVMWPPHCEQGTYGAELVDEIKNNVDFTAKKGTGTQESYSGFKDAGGTRTDLNDKLRKRKVKKLLVTGVATDYCVDATAKDALELQFKVYILVNMCRGVTPKDSVEALKARHAQGAKLVRVKGLNEGAQHDLSSIQDKIEDYDSLEDLMKCEFNANRASGIYNKGRKKVAQELAKRRRK